MNFRSSQAHGRSGLQRLPATQMRSLLPPSVMSAPSWDVPGGASSLLTISPLDLTLTLSLFTAHEPTQAALAPVLLSPAQISFCLDSSCL